MPIAPQARTAYLLLRAGVAFAFIYPPLSAVFGDPYTWFGYFPAFVVTAATAVGISNLVLLHAFGVVELIIGVWILSGYKIFLPSLLATLMLVAIVGFNLSQFDVVFRDLSIASMSFALALINFKKTI